MDRHVKHTLSVNEATRESTRVREVDSHQWSAVGWVTVSWATASVVAQKVARSRGNILTEVRDE